MTSFQRVWIAEKAAAGKIIAEWLSKKLGQPLSSQSSYAAIGSTDAVTWLSGHILEQFEMEDYDPAYAKWRLDYLPFIPSPFQLKPKSSDARSKDKIALISKLTRSCKEVIGACDPDAEGQLLQDELLEFIGNQKPVTRFLASALDDAALDKAYASMKPNSEYRGWYESALARSRADWLYGINMTRACSLHAQRAGAPFRFSVGRVRTPTMGLVVRRELEIRNFKPVDFHIPHISLNSTPGFRAAWFVPGAPQNGVTVYDDPRVDPEGRLLDKAAADAIVAAALAAGQATVTSAETKAGTESPPLPFALSSLQAHCSRVYGLTAAKTLEIAQALYLRKLTTYPRVDCDYLPESQHTDAPQVLRSLSQATQALPAAFGAALKGARPALKSRAWNDSKVTAHHAVIPSMLSGANALDGLSDVELKVYAEIVNRYVLQFWPAAKFSTTELVLAVKSRTAASGAELFSARGRQYLDEGWRKAFDLSSEEDAQDGAVAKLPALTKGQTLAIGAAEVESKRTTPPKRYDDGSLITAMKNVHQYVQNPEYRKRLKESVGIGTEATRGPTIEDLVKRSLFLRKGKELHPSDGAMALIGALPDSMTTPDMTAMWQQLNDKVRAGEASEKQFIDKLIPWLEGLVKQSATFFTEAQFKGMAAPAGAGGQRRGGPDAQVTSFKCFGNFEKTGCGSPLRRIKGQYGYFFGCSSEECRKVFRDVGGKPAEKSAAPASAESGPTHKCPSCEGGQLRRVTRKDGSGYFWGCGNWKSGCKAIFNELDGAPDFEGKSRSGAGAPGASAGGVRYACPQCQSGQLLRRTRKDGSGHFWGCSDWKSGCKAGYEDVDGAPDLQGKSSGGAKGGTRGAGSGGAGGESGQSSDMKKYACAACNAGFLRQVPRKDGSGHFWGCSNWKGSCKAMYNDLNGEPDLEGRGGRSGGPKLPRPPRAHGRRSSSPSPYKAPTPFNT